MPSTFVPRDIPQALREAVNRTHSSWHSTLLAGLEAVAESDPVYLPDLVRDDYLPNQGRIFAAFSQPLQAVRHVLVGEGPYPRAESASGFCFMDGAVQELWSEKGLSKRVNRATSLRNFMKMLLVADGRLSVSQTTGDALSGIAQQAQSSSSTMIQTLAELQDNLHRHGFLLLNATLVYRAHVPPAKESRAWEPFLKTVFTSLAEHAGQAKQALPQLVLWGKIAERLSVMPEAASFPQDVSEHPYNLSFIANPQMQRLFAPMTLLNKTM
ncbi:MAG: uracil-DNA glycosylase [Oxalobacter sp.]|nr:MAG: uracil-DNA glycosylase [Oxalobacter sp.]